MSVSVSFLLACSNIAYFWICLKIYFLSFNLENTKYIFKKSNYVLPHFLKRSTKFISNNKKINRSAMIRFCPKRYSYFLCSVSDQSDFIDTRRSVLRSAKKWWNKRYMWVSLLEIFFVDTVMFILWIGIQCFVSNILRLLALC